MNFAAIQFKNVNDFVIVYYFSPFFLNFASIQFKKCQWFCHFLLFFMNFAAIQFKNVNDFVIFNDFSSFFMNFAAIQFKNVNCFGIFFIFFMIFSQNLIRWLVRTYLGSISSAPISKYQIVMSWPVAVSGLKPDTGFMTYFDIR